MTVFSSVFGAGQRVHSILLQRRPHELLVHGIPRRLRILSLLLLLVHASNLLFIIHDRLLVCHLTNGLDIVLDLRVKRLLLFLAIDSTSTLLPLILQLLLLLFQKLPTKHLLKLLLLSLVGLLNPHKGHFIHLIVVGRIPLIKLCVAHRERVIILVLHSNVLDVIEKACEIFGNLLEFAPLLGLVDY